MDRIKVDSSIERTDLQPIAAPIQSYVQPGPSPLRGLAEGLGKFDTGLKEFIDTRAKKQADDDALRGEAEFYRKHDGTIAEGIAAGKYPAQWSPAFVNGYKKTQGNVRGVQLQNDFQAAYDAWPGKNDENPKAYEIFVQQWMADNVGPDEDPRILKSLLPHIASAVTDGSNRYIQDRHKLVYGGAVDATIAGAGQDVDKAVQDGLSVPEGTNYPALWESIAAKREEAVKTGVRPDDLDLSLMQTMSAKILTTRDPELLKFFDQKVPGKDYTYGESPDGIKIKKETLDSLDVINRRSLSDESEAAKAANKAALDAAEAEAGNLLATDPTKPLPEELIARGSKLDGGFRAKTEGWRDTFAKRLPSDPKAIDAVYDEMYTATQTGGDPEKIVRDAASQGVFTNPEDFVKAQAAAKSMASGADGIKKVYDDQSYKNIEKVIAGRTQGADPFTGDPMVGISNEGLEATFDFRKKVTQWALQNPNATEQEQADAINGIGKSVLDSMAAPEAGATDNGSGLIYNRDTKQFSFPNPYTDQVKELNPEGDTKGKSVGEIIQEQADEAIAKGKAAAEAAKPEDDGEASDYLNGLTPEQRTSLDGRAKAFGLSTEEYAKKLLAPKADSKDDALTAKPISYNPDTTATEGETPKTTAGNPVMTQQIATDLIDKSLVEQADSGDGARTVRIPAQADDPKAGRLLDLIKVHEADGNYNAVYGKAHSTVDLGQYSLNQILSMQVAARARGVKSTAIGGYQFIYKTLRGLKGEMGLTGNEQFTPKLQDQLAMHLLRRRGYDQFKAGTLSKRGFALRIAQEWASLPDPRTGRSVYAGDGLNASSVHPSRVLGELGLIQQAGYEPETPAANISPASKGEGTIAPAYADIPDVDEGGNAGQLAKFTQWNSDPVANNEANLKTINPQLASVVKAAQKYAPPGVQIVVGSGKRDAAQQDMAIKWGWSKKRDSDHLDGSAVDLWPIINGKLKFDPATQVAISKAMKRAAKELGVDLDVGADWRKKDLPHYAVKKTTGA
jgi:muramidase (phage lysozyme)